MNQPDPNQDFLSVYDDTLKALKKDPDSPVLKHRAVLALARAGALEFARGEYNRYGLDKVRHHEDIMALGGRLLKDMALAAKGKARIDYARRSADQYEKAFQDTNGYYSGINAATMSLIAGVPEDMVADRARTILGLLPPPDNLDDEELYFVEATRAEAHLILGQPNKAANILREAIYHDPLNYTAHASTLKQFRMILSARGEAGNWTQPFTPPKAAHFAGHIFTPSQEAVKGQNALDKEAVKALKIEISETIQINDIGFGYGALAAGADILIAETLVAEGAELHVVLPTDEKTFVQTSVTPFGKSWIKRFKTCMKNATSVRILKEDQDWPNSLLGSYSSQIAMGLAVMRAATLSTDMAQLLIWDGKVSLDPMSTASDAQIWQDTRREQIVIPYPGKRGARKDPSPKDLSAADKGLNAVLVLCHDTDLSDSEVELIGDCASGFDMINQNTAPHKTIFTFPTLEGAARFTIKVLELDVAPASNLRLGGFSAFAARDDLKDQVSIAAKIVEGAPPGSVYVAENFAAVLAARFENEFKVEYVGNSSVRKYGKALRMFHLRAQTAI